MTAIGGIVLSLAAGLGLGAFFFGGLWWTVSRLPTSGRPVPMMLGSLLLRMGVAGGGFFVLSAGHWPRLLGCLAGFALARFVVRLILRRTPPLDRAPAAATAALQGEGAA
jgi:F1F0 ATPase subunit 2